MATNVLAQHPDVRWVIQQDAETLANGLSHPTYFRLMLATEQIHEWLSNGPYHRTDEYVRWRNCIRDAIRMQHSKGLAPLAAATVQVAAALYSERDF
ncbi:MAG: hypothetical protein F4X65_03780 [Chloroflexi bacterium]|nr:hypothetical protein [Chloroflexota bacterium]